MSTPSLSRALLQAHIALLRVGLIKGIGCALVLIAALIWKVGLPQLEAQLQQQKSALASLRQSLNALDRPIPTAPRTVSEERLDNFYNTLGESNYAEQQVKTIFSLAGKSGLSLTRGEYRLAAEKNGRYSTYQIILPLKGSYSAIRQFCEQILLTIPFASIDDLHFKRDTIANRTVETRMQLTLYLNDASISTRPKVFDAADEL